MKGHFVLIIRLPVPDNANTVLSKQHHCTGNVVFHTTLSHIRNQLQKLASRVTLTFFVSDLNSDSLLYNTLQNNTTFALVFKCVSVFND